VRAAEHAACLLHAMTDDVAAAVRALGRAHVDRTLERVEGVSLAALGELERLGTRCRSGRTWPWDLRRRWRKPVRPRKSQMV
jgi:hypothetical protein